MKKPVKVSITACQTSTSGSVILGDHLVGTRQYFTLDITTVEETEYFKPHKTLIRVALSHGDLQLLSQSMGRMEVKGNLDLYNRESYEIPRGDATGAAKKATQDMKDAIAQRFELMKARLREIRHRVSETKATKGDKEYILNQLKGLDTELDQNLPYFQTLAAEGVEEVGREVMSQVVGQMDNMLKSLGVKKMNRLKVLDTQSLLQIKGKQDES